MEQVGRHATLDCDWLMCLRGLLYALTKRSTVIAIICPALPCLFM
jgi:hypothetical protein